MFASDSDVGTLKRVAFGDIPSLALYGQHFPTRLIHTIDRSLKRERQDRFADCGEFAGELRACLSEIGGAFADTDYHAWLARIAGHLSVPKPLPLLSEDAVQRTESVPAVAAHTQEVDAMLKSHEVRDEPQDETVLMPAFPSTSDLSEEATQISRISPNTDDDLPTRVSLRVVGTKTRPSVAGFEPVAEPMMHSKGQGRLLIWLVLAAIIGVAAVFGLDSNSPSDVTSVSPAPSQDLHQALTHNDQLSKEDFTNFVETHRSTLNPCFARHAREQKKRLLEITIRNSGKPISVEIRPAKPKFRLCVRKVITKSWKFPSFRGRSIQHRTQLNP